MVTSVNNTQTAQTASSTSRASIANNFETFMTLLSAQLANQDPLSPLDTKDFTNQLVQFSGVEQQLKTNDLLTSLSSLTRASVGATAVSYLGRQATVKTDQGALGETGSVNWDYALPAKATNISVSVVNASGRTVATLNGNGDAGAHSVTWDGKTLGGSRAPAGTYRLVVTATNAADAAVTANITRTGLVGAVDMSGTNPSINVDGVSAGIDQITNLRLTQ